MGTLVPHMGIHVHMIPHIPHISHGHRLKIGNPWLVEIMYVHIGEHFKNTLTFFKFFGENLC
jgi:hypothetical protein